ncbi:MAG TPA: glycoside hydrolase family 38 C-terminal domain-containing protein [Thermoanaerobaculia bacterium]|jgi:alpha-mannosidase
MLHRPILLALLAVSALAQTPDLSKQPTLYIVGYAHLDTQWRWEYPQTIGEFLPKTMRENFALFEKYPHYVFNFSGANRYRLMKEYYPADYERLRGYVKAGRWFPAGSSMEESDVNSPSAESILRQVLYGNTFFRREFGVASEEYMLPDCFGFPSSLPSLLAHAGIRGFSTQKLTWGSNAQVGGEGSPEETPKGIPFNVGVWEGTDGKGVIAALNPGDYGGDIRYDLTKSEPPPNTKRFIDWPRRVERDGKVSGIYADYHYYGTGDTGGSPSESSVAMAEELATKSDGSLRVISSKADQMFRDISRSGRDTSRLPRYKGDLELTNHSAGSLTSQAYQKKWNHDNELLADAAERASVAAMWLGARTYPLERLNNAWALVMGGQFHDIAAGTATPKAYEYSWNDDAIARNQFNVVLKDAVEAIASQLDTRTKGKPLILYNPLNVPRHEGTLTVPPVGFAVYDLPDGANMESGLKIDEHSIENGRYRLTIDGNGDISSIRDKDARREILSAPARLAFQTEKPHDWPAWNMDWDDQKQPPRGYVGGRAKIRVLERGPVRAALEITRDAEGSHFVQIISLTAPGDSANRIEIQNQIDWKTSAAALKATFPLTAKNPKATYNWEVGTVERGNNEPRQFEVPSHQWIDLTDASGDFGVSILTGAKYGSDKPDDSTLRLTLLYTPGLGTGNGASYADQTSQDWGHHEFTYAIYAHKADWRDGTQWQAMQLDQPLLVFDATKHPGPLGKRFSFLHTSTPSVRVMALKKAERSDDIVVRVVEIGGRAARDVRIAFASPITAVREVDAQERKIRNMEVDDEGIAIDLSPYQLRTFALKLAPPDFSVRRVQSQSIALKTDETLPGLATEMLPSTIPFGAIAFQTNGKALSPEGQQIAIPKRFHRIYVLAAALEGQREPPLGRIQYWSGKIGQWDTRLWQTRVVDLPPYPDAPPNAPPRQRTVTEFAGLDPAFMKPAPIAWFASHSHAADGSNLPYQYSYLFAYTASVDGTLTLPDNDKIRIFAITASDQGREIQPLERKP